MKETNKKKVVAISGSTRSHSSNHNLIRAIELLTSDEIEFIHYPSVSLVPHFNPDLDTEPPPEEVARLRRLLRLADGILICTPEYAMGLPGSLKNLIDWTVSSCEFSQKPVLAITASTSGQKAHASLLETLQVIEASVEETNLLIPFIRSKVNDAFQVTDDATLEQLLQVIDSFKKAMSTGT